MTTVRLGEPIAAEARRAVERALQLRHFKWDTQVGDVGVVFPQPLLIARGEWDQLCVQAEHAASELYGLERFVAARPDFQRKIGIPRRLRPFLVPDASTRGPRVLRFDFHPTREGWVISEVNADVPGGFTEASALPTLYAPFCGEVARPPCPLTAWAEAVAAAVPSGDAALLYAPGHLEDVQVALTLDRELRHYGFTPHLVQSPAALGWVGGRAYLAGVSLTLIVRFFQAEWLAAWPGQQGWRELFGSSQATRVLHEPACVVSENKRLGLLFDEAGILHRLFPESREPSDVPANDRGDWVLKAAYTNTGDEVHLGMELSAAAWRRQMRRAWWNPGGWIAQRRFETLALSSVAGLVRPCVGIYVVNERAAGAYVRLSHGQVTDARAFEAPLFIQPDDPPPDDP